MKLRTLAALVAVPTLLTGGTALALRKTDAPERQLEAAEGARPRAYRAVDWDVLPTPAPRAAWQKFAADHPTWHSLWDRQTGVPLRLWGEGVAAPGAMRDAAIAEQAARRMLADHLDLLAPGASIGDFELVSNVVHGRGTMRTVGFTQHHQGLRVVGGQVSFLFKHDRLFVIGSEALPNVKVPPTTFAAAAPSLLKSQALGWIQSLRAAGATVGEIGETAILPVIRDGKAGGIEYRVVRAVDVATTGPVGRWDVYVDASTGQPVARRQKLHFGRGTLTYHVPERGPTRARKDFPAIFTQVQVDGASAASNDAGLLEWAGTAAAQVTTTIVGPFAKVNNAAGNLASAVLTLAPDNSVVWDLSSDEKGDAQLSAFIHANIVKQYAKKNLNPDLAFLDQQLNVFVNEADHCNAFSNGGDQIHFFSAGAVDVGGGQQLQCENTGRIADVVYHEFGHSLHGTSIIPGAGFFDGAMSEGVSDYLAATITGDHGMGRGFFPGDDSALRDLDPADGEKRWPDDLVGEVHADGEIIGGTLWDLRKAMIAEFGEADGVRRADDIYYAILQTAADIPSTYVSALAQDDDDGDITNGTPNRCLILKTFDAHGLGLVDNQSVTLQIGQPQVDGFHVSLAAKDVSPCEGTAGLGPMTLKWKLRGAATTTDIPMEGASDVYSATIPTQPDGSVVQYQIVIDLTDGRSLTFPDNRADNMYEMYVGPVETIYCASFDQQPADWTTGASSGSNEWQWGAPTGAGGDPKEAFSGSSVFGIDLGTGSNNGTYEPDTTQFATMPEIDVSAYKTVHLQYRRWLGVEDGFFDHAVIDADGTTVWQNRASANEFVASVHHTDREWRFQDVDLSPQAADGKVKVTFKLTSDQGLELSGWNLDDVCLVGIGDADPPEGGCCSTSGKGAGSGVVLSIFTGLALWIRRRRRAA